MPSPWWSTSHAPSAAPTTIATTAAERRGERVPGPPPARESAARPVRVMVRTVVVMSGTPSLRTVALRSPIAKAVTAMRV